MLTKNWIGVNHDIAERKRVEAALKRSEERHALAQRAANIGSWDWDIRTGDLCWSDTIEPIFGFGRGEFGATYEAFLDCIHPEDRQHVIDSVNACVEAGADYDIEHRIVWPDGTVRWVSETGDVFWDEHGEAIRMLGIVQDITERKQAQEALRRYADRLQVLHEIDRAVVATHSVAEIAQATLRHVRQLVGCLRASVIEFNVEANELMVLAADADGETRVGKGWRSPLDGVWSIMDELAQGKIHTEEDIQTLPSSSPLVEALRAEGVRAYVNVPIISQGEPICSLNLGMASPGDVTSEQADIAREVADELAVGIHHARLHQQVQQHAAELEKQVARRTAALRASEARFRAIFEEAGIGIALVDMEGRLVESNPALQEILGCRAEELHGMSFVEIIHPDDGPADMKLYEELMAGRRDDNKYKVKRCHTRKDGQLRWCNLTVSLVQKAWGKSQYAIVMVEDVTEQKQIQQALIQSEKLAITGRLAASLAHEINNPLQSVIGCLGLAGESLAEGEDAGEFLQIATEELERAAGIVTQLRDLNRPSRPEEREPTDVNALLEQVLMLTKKQCQKYQVEVNWEVGDDLPPLVLAPDRMRQVFLNLMLNAVDAMPEGGRLQVGTSRTSDPAGVCVSFADSGRGIAPDVVSRVFDPFYTTKPEGLGLGLYVTHNIVAEHGGHVEVESQVGEGATFKVWLPA